MSGETDKYVSGWTVETLKEHFETLLNEKDKALIASLVAVKEENRKTEVQAEKRFDLLNELRQGVATTDQMEALEKIVSELGNRLNRSEGQVKGSDGQISKIYAAIGAVGTALAILVLLANNIIK